MPFGGADKQDKNMKTLKDINLQNKTVLLRADLDISDGGDFRLEAGIPTIKYLLENDCKIVIIAHRGRPEGKVDSRFSLLSVFEKLKTYFLDKKENDFKFVSDIISSEANEAVEKSKTGDIIMFENLRFWKQEEENNERFAEYLAGFADIFVNDAFAVCHRKHASIFGIPKFLPSSAGLRLEKEIEILNQAMKNPKKPAVAIIGGAKIETKIPCIESLSKIYDTVLVGGRLGIETSFRHPEPSLALARMGEGSYPTFANNIIIPTDYVDEQKFDIGGKTIEKYKQIISSAKTIVWNGPMGKFEDPDFIRGTELIADAIIESGAYSIIGGGDTIAAINKLGIPFDKFGWVSTGGGAMLTMMAGEELAGIKALSFVSSS